MTPEELIARAHDELMRSLPESLTPEERENIEKAFVLAEEAHRPQKRKDGEPYILHPIRVALVVIREMMQTDASIICAAFSRTLIPSRTVTSR